VQEEVDVLGDSDIDASRESAPEVHFAYWRDSADEMRVRFGVKGKLAPSEMGVRNVGDGNHRRFAWPARRDPAVRATRCIN